MGYIYQIYCDIPGITSTYIGKTTRTIKERFQEHLQEARHNRRNFKFYNAIRKYGEDHFFIKQLECCSNETLNEKEKYWIKYYNTFLDGWNSTEGGDGNITWSDEMKEQHSLLMKQYYNNNPVSLKTKEKQSKIMKEKWADQIYKEKLRNAQKQSYINNPNRREQQRINTLKRYEDPKEREKSSLAQQKRWSNPEEHKKASLAHIKSHGKKVRCIETGEIFNCIADACEKLGKKRTATGISSCLKGNKKSAYGYHWERIE